MVTNIGHLELSLHIYQWEYILYNARIPCGHRKDVLRCTYGYYESLRALCGHRTACQFKDIIKWPHEVLLLPRGALADIFNSIDELQLNSKTPHGYVSRFKQLSRRLYGAHRMTSRCPYDSRTNNQVTHSSTGKNHCACDHNFTAKKFRTDSP